MPFPASFPSLIRRRIAEIATPGLSVHPAATLQKLTGAKTGAKPLRRIALEGELELNDRLAVYFPSGAGALQGRGLEAARGRKVPGVRRFITSEGQNIRRPARVIFQGGKHHALT